MRPPSEASPQKRRASPEVGAVSRQALQRPSADLKQGSRKIARFCGKRRSNEAMQTATEGRRRKSAGRDDESLNRHIGLRHDKHPSRVLSLRVLFVILRADTTAAG